MEKKESGVEAFAPETIEKMDEDAAAAEAVDSDVTANDKTLITAVETPGENKNVLNLQEDELISQETLRESPIQWPERFPGMEEFLTMSETPIYTPTVDRSNNLTSDDIAHMNQLSQLAPDQLVEKIKSLQDEVYQLGLREAKEMTRGKLLGIFDRDQLLKRQGWKREKIKSLLDEDYQLGLLQAKDITHEKLLGYTTVTSC